MVMIAMVFTVYMFWIYLVDGDSRYIVDALCFVFLTVLGLVVPSIYLIVSWRLARSTRLAHEEETAQPGRWRASEMELRPVGNNGT